MSEPEGDALWDQEVCLSVWVKVQARPNPEYFEGLQGRTPEGAAITAVFSGCENLANIDGYADLIGTAYITHIEEF